MKYNFLLMYIQQGRNCPCCVVLPDICCTAG